MNIFPCCSVSLLQALKLLKASQASFAGQHKFTKSKGLGGLEPLILITLIPFTLSYNYCLLNGMIIHT